VPQVLRVTALEFCHPVLLLILTVAYDALLDRHEAITFCGTMVR
jgi:hypothetical protein